MCEILERDLGKEGTYDPNNKAITEWEREVRDKEMGDSLEPGSKDSTRVEGARAGLHLRILVEGVGELLKEELWAMMDGEAEMPGWFVQGRTVLLPKTNARGGPSSSGR